MLENLLDFFFIIFGSIVLIFVILIEFIIDFVMFFIFLIIKSIEKLRKLF